MDRERQNKILPYLMLMPAMAVMAIVVIYPIFSCIVTSFTQEEAAADRGFIPDFLTDH